MYMPTFGAQATATPGAKRSCNGTLWAVPPLYHYVIGVSGGDAQELVVSTWYTSFFVEATKHLPDIASGVRAAPDPPAIWKNHAKQQGQT
jgi:hypothetical protein